MQSETAQPVALVTGAARRLGAATARRLHAAGYRLALHYRGSRDEAAALAADLNRLRPGSAFILQADLVAVDGAQALADGLLAESGRCDLLVNNASSFYPTRLGEVTAEQWDDLFGSNLRGPFFLVQALMAPLRAARGSVVNIIDIHAQRPLAGYPVYSMAKAGLLMLTMSLALELAPAVRVNGVSPGAILAPEAEINQRADLESSIPLARTGHPDDIADAVAWLAQAPYVTGQVVAVDGGRSIAI